MTPDARLKTVSHLLSLMEESPTIPADSILASYFRNNRFIGSKDRRFLGDFFYTLLRKRGPSLYWRTFFEKELPSSAFTSQDVEVLVFFLLSTNASLEDLEDVCKESPYGFQRLSVKEKQFFEKVAKTPLSTLPEWATSHTPQELIPFFKESLPISWMEEVSALTLEPSFDCRINPLLITRQEMQNTFLQEGIEAPSTPFSSFGVRFMKRFSLNHHPLFKEGKIEIQDEGSQLLCLLLNACSPKRILDYCAGAGGKALFLGALMKNKGTILATDINDVRLEKAKERIKRSGLQNIQLRSLTDTKYFKRQKHSFDCVLVDAPCSGSGTWRRNPDQKWKITPENIKDLAALQLSILKKASAFVFPHGYLLYATCSFFKEENENVVEAFLQSDEGSPFHLVPAKENLALPEEAFKGPFLSLSPHRTQTDGFFGALLKKKSGF